MEIIIIILLIVLNGIFAMTETAIISSKKARLEDAAKKGSTNARIALELSRSPEEFLSAVQVGITLIGIISGVYGGATLTEDVVPVIKSIPFLSFYATEISYLLVVGVITYLSLVIGELVPKTIAINNPEKMAIIIAPFIRMVAKITYPVVRFLSFSTKVFIKIFRIKENANPPVTEEELKLLIDQGAVFGTIEKKEGELIKRIFKFGDRRASSIMTQRHEIVWIDVNQTPEEIKEFILAHDHSVYPVCNKELDNILGVVNVLDYMKCPDTAPNIMNLIKEPIFIPYGYSSIKLIERLREKKFYTAVVIDEYGSVRGLIKLRDIIENIIGDLPEIGEVEEPRVIKRDDNSYLVDGETLLDDLSDIIYIDIEDKDKGFLTIAGYFIHKIKKLPATGDKITVKDFSMEIIDMDGNRIDKILLTKHNDESINA
jgi:putative hemolysin